MQVKRWAEVIFKSYRVYQAALSLGNATLVVNPKLEEKLMKSEVGGDFIKYFKKLGPADSYTGIIPDLIIDQKVSTLSMLSLLWESAKKGEEMRKIANSKEFKQMDELIINLNSATNELSR